MTESTHSDLIAQAAKFLIDNNITLDEIQAYEDHNPGTPAQPATTDEGSPLLVAAAATGAPATGDPITGAAASPDAAAPANSNGPSDENDGITPEDLKALVTGQVEVTVDPVIRPADIAGVSNDPSLSNVELTAKLAALTSRFNNLVAAHYPDQF